MNFKTLFSYVCLFVFLLFAFFQWNDPDPQIWIPLYLIPAVLTVLSHKKRIAVSALFTAALVYTLWGASLFPPEWEGVMLNQGMKTLNIELGRESLGLVTAAILLAIQGFLNK